MPYILRSPLYIFLERKKVANKKIAVNLNWYRNAHYRESNEAKIAYKAEMSEQIARLPVFDKVSLELVIYPQTRRKFDLGNVGSITEKFFLDALVESGKLPDDDYTHMTQSTTTFGNVDALNPRVEIILRNNHV